MNLYASRVDELVRIWQQVLKRASIGINSDFFDLGGDSSQATALFAEIARVCGRELPPVTICRAPTIATLAALLDEPDAWPFPPAVLLKPGVENPPVFITHGLGDTVLSLHEVLLHIQTKHPIYGLQARGIDGLEPPFERIEDMAEFHLQAIKQIQPGGPYFLVGYSLGGLVALEIAQRLRESGEGVALLAMVESYPHRRFLPTGQRLRLIARRAKYRLKQGTRPHPSNNVGYSAPATGEPLSPILQRMRAAEYLALRNYRPRYHRGKIRFVKAVDNPEFPDDPIAVWAKLAEQFESETVTGSHYSILTTHSERLGSVLSRFLQEACRCR
jgi:acetoacetyl-CoA synthetase